MSAEIWKNASRLKRPRRSYKGKGGAIGCGSFVLCPADISIGSEHGVRNNSPRDRKRWVMIYGC